MAKPKTKAKRKPQDEDEAESQRFLEAAAALEADGGLNPTEGEVAFERAMEKIAPAKARRPDSS